MNFGETKFDPISQLRKKFKNGFQGNFQLSLLVLELLKVPWIKNQIKQMEEKMHKSWMHMDDLL